MTDTPLDWIDNELLELDAAGLRRRLAIRTSTQSATIVIDGKPLINFGSNDYLGLAAEPLNEAVIDAVRQSGWGSGASSLVTGRGAIHAELESEIANFEGTEAALLFPSGFAANVGAITSLASKGDVIFSDAKNHASIIDGCRLSGARVQIYPHCDVDYLRMILPQAGAFRRRLIVTDGLFSMDGDLAPLCDLAALAEEHDAMLMVDEAHATGVFGERGRGTAEYWGVEEGVHIRVGTLSKAAGSIGGFVAGSRSLVEWIANRARTYVFSTAPPEAIAAAGLAGLKRIQDEPHRREKLLSSATDLRRRLLAVGCDTGTSSSQIIPIMIGEPQATMRFATQIREAGFFVPGIRPPTVPEGESLLRISLSYAHTEEMLDRLVAEIGDVLFGKTGTKSHH
ncbi:MAG: 8-amino-7-oxononanoate synthase [Planctomycetaceae bacterium]|nr:8-amino-7-oxononanoate synthase [Planctomycetales bacterium]MCB9921563.1 8-amino-7-oxononanoate synthase [Planctomycetaceae bacterium]